MMALLTRLGSVLTGRVLFGVVTAGVVIIGGMGVKLWVMGHQLENARSSLSAERTKKDSCLAENARFDQQIRQQNELIEQNAINAELLRQSMERASAEYEKRIASARAIAGLRAVSEDPLERCEEARRLLIHE